MLVAIIAFFCGRNYYVIKKPSGNVFATFLKATWNGLRNSCKSKEKKDHFLDHCDPVKYPAASISDFKWVYPVIVMYLPIPFYRALAEMQGECCSTSQTIANECGRLPQLMLNCFRTQIN